MAAKRQRFIQRRKSLGFTQESLAEHLNMGRNTVERWENGVTQPQPCTRPKIATALRLTLDELDDVFAEPTIATTAVPAVHHAELIVLTDHGPTVTGDQSGSAKHSVRVEIDDMNRRELLRLISMTGTLLALPTNGTVLDTDRLAHATEAPGAIDIAAVEAYSTLNTHLWATFALTSTKAQLLPLVQGQLAVVADSLRQAHSPATRTQLCVVAADLFQLAGEIFFDSDRYTDAAHCYSLAADAARTAHSYDLWACALTRHAFIAVYERNYPAAEPLLELAATIAERGDPSLSTRHWVAAVQAETYAGLGNTDACLHALDNAEAVQQLSGTVHNGGWLRFNGSRLAEERGTCHVALGQPDRAETALQDALSHNGLTPRRRASIHTDLAMIGVHRRDAERITSYANKALITAKTTHSAVIGRKLRALQPHLEPMLGDKSIRTLHTDITALTTARIITT